MGEFKKKLFLLLKIVFVQLVFLLLFYFNLNLKNKAWNDEFNKIRASERMANVGLPVKIFIPKINVNTKIERVGVTRQGEMEVPSNAQDVGWFELGSRPGQVGSAVIAGHFDGKDGGEGVFNNLNELKSGDTISVTDEDGKINIFVVRESREYLPGFATEVFEQAEGKHLNLITCDGVWIGKEKSYSKRLVVFADLMN